jgi:hypothetical protein
VLRDRFSARLLSFVRRAETPTRVSTRGFASIGANADGPAQRSRPGEKDLLQCLNALTVVPRPSVGAETNFFLSARSQKKMTASTLRHCCGIGSMKIKRPRARRLQIFQSDGRKNFSIRNGEKKSARSSAQIFSDTDF